MVRRLPFLFPSHEEGRFMPSFILESTRLLLRPPETSDVASLMELMEWDVAKNLSRVPYPYREEHARAFVGRQDEVRAKGTDYAFALARKEDGAFLGMGGVHLRETRYELGYWLGRPFWSQGYATEAAEALLAFAFRNLRQDVVEAGWFHDNPASGRVLEKVGFHPEGTRLMDCAARGAKVLCNVVVMSRAEFARKEAA
jgi:RimJ/RimL family protein N-acetyltransferase